MAKGPPAMDPRASTPTPPPAYPRISDADAAALYSRILERCSARTPKGAPVLVLDLDGTLMDNRPRTVAILHDLSKIWREKYPEAAVELEGSTNERLAYLLNDSLRRLRVVDPALVAEATEYWRRRFFADDDLRHDVALPGAVHFVRECHARGATVVYLTGRDLPMMGLGTFASLRTLGFPIGVAGVEFILKPDAQMADEAFKRMIAPTLARVGEVVASFDNEPANCNLFKEAYPEAEVVFVDTQHVPGAPPLREDVLVVGDFAIAAGLSPSIPPPEGEP
jgi:beta-phosphoglucomutase-like phosphatase (HAD superfamily)